jgi:hypothetical protein
MGKKTFRGSFDSQSELFKMNYHDEDNIQITDKKIDLYPNYSNAIQLFAKNK